MDLDNKAIARRVNELIEYKTIGKRSLFGEKCGWSKQRVTNVLAGKAIGLAVVAAILRAFPDLNARWLIFGEGNMLTIHNPRFGSRYDNIITFEKYLPVMTSQESELLARGKTDWDDATIQRWSDTISERQKSLAARIAKHGRK